MVIDDIVLAKGTIEQIIQTKDGITYLVRFVSDNGKYSWAQVHDNQIQAVDKINLN